MSDNAPCTEKVKLREHDLQDIWHGTDQTTSYSFRIYPQRLPNLRISHPPLDMKFTFRRRTFEIFHDELDKHYISKQCKINRDILNDYINLKDLDGDRIQSINSIQLVGAASTTEQEIVEISKLYSCDLRQVVDFFQLPYLSILYSTKKTTYIDEYLRMQGILKDLSDEEKQRLLRQDMEQVREKIKYYEEQLRQYDTTNGEKNYVHNLATLVSDKQRMHFFKRLFIQLVTKTRDIFVKHRIVHCDIKTTNIFVDMIPEFWQVYSKALLERQEKIKNRITLSRYDDVDEQDEQFIKFLSWSFKNDDLKKKIMLNPDDQKLVLADFEYSYFLRDGEDQRNFDRIKFIKLLLRRNTQNLSLEVARAKELYKSVEVHKKEEALLSKVNSINETNNVKDTDESPKNNVKSLLSVGEASTANTMGTITGMSTLSCVNTPTMTTLDNIAGCAQNVKQPKQSAADVKLALLEKDLHKHLDSIDLEKYLVFQLGLVLLELFIPEEHFNIYGPNNPKYIYFTNGQFEQFWSQGSKTFTNNMFLIESGMDTFHIVEFKDLVNSMLVANVEKRITLDKILKHPFVMGYLARQ